MDQVRKPFYQIVGGKLVVNPHIYQAQVLKSKKKVVAAIAGTQSGKTIIGPYWLYMKMMELGPGDYMVVGPYSNLLQFKVIPAFKELFVDKLNMGRISMHPFPVFRSHDGKYQVFFGHAKNPDTLESATVKAVWADEAGQDAFKRSAWEALNRRLAIHDGPALITTTPYNFDWLYRDIYLPWKEANGNHPRIDVIQFESIANPYFPREVWEEQKRLLPKWKFDMFFRGRFTRPAGLIYDVFEYGKHVYDGVVPQDDVRAVIVGLDFGGTNLVGLKLCVIGDRVYVDDAYYGGRATVQQHVQHLMSWRHTMTADAIFAAYGGASGEQYWRDEFAFHGFYVRAPSAKGAGSVVFGIEKVYELLNSGRLYVNASLERLIDEFGTYSWEVDDEGNPIYGQIKNKSGYHYLDALRYAVVGGAHIIDSVYRSNDAPPMTLTWDGQRRKKRRRTVKKNTGKVVKAAIFDPNSKGVPLWLLRQEEHSLQKKSAGN